VLQLPQGEKMMLKHWKKPNFFQDSQAPVGDFVELIKYILSKRVLSQPTLTINTLNEYLTTLSRTRDKEIRYSIFTKIIKQIILYKMYQTICYFFLGLSADLFGFTKKTPYI
jgi:hypothetical protein